eukprot:COSAG01_NODE_184_length_22692_cov_155.762758_17_plen_116_part_00
MEWRALAGVLSEGELFEGAELELVSRREEGGAGAWSMERLSRTLYAQADARYHVPLPWAGTRSELTALCCDPVLAVSRSAPRAWLRGRFCVSRPLRGRRSTWSGRRCCASCGSAS